MLKNRPLLKVADTNMSLVGSDLDKKIRAANAAEDPSWLGAGREKGVQVWRIENFGCKPVAKENHGVFFDGDSYIVLHTHSAGVYTAYFWLGKFTTQDEAGTAAIKVIQLDDILGGMPRQVRVVQGAEPAEFLELFPLFEVFEGGVASGFTHVDRDKKAAPTPRLLMLRSISGGSKSGMRMYQRKPVLNSLNENDCFVLDLTERIYCFQGNASSVWEKQAASSEASKLASNRTNGCKVAVVTSDDAPAEFWKALGVEDGNGKGKVKAQPDPTIFSESRVLKLFRVSDASGSLEVTKVAEGEVLPKAVLKSEDVFIVDAAAEVFVWVGKGASKNERAQSLTVAQKYLNDNSSNRDADTPISSVVEGLEDAFFASFFKE